MAEFKFFCPTCGQHILCDTGHSGMQINCPACQQSILVPPAPAATMPAPPPPAPVYALHQSPNSAASQRQYPVTPVAQPAVPIQSRALQTVLIIVIAVLVLAGLGVGGWYGYTHLKLLSGHGHLPAGLVALWSGEGNANDSVGGSIGTLTGSAAYESGKVGQAFALHGNRDFVNVGNPASLQLQDFTISAWVKRASPSVVSYGSYGIGVIYGYGYGGYGLYLDPSGRPALSKIGLNETKPDMSITDTAFHHLAVTQSGSTVIFYIDGIAYPAPGYDPGFVFSTMAAIGARGDNSDNSFLGLIDEIGVFNRALSAAEIQAIYTAQK